MSTRMQILCANQSVQPDSILLKLPREMRDEIYHNLLLIDCCMYHALAPQFLQFVPQAPLPSTTGPEDCPEVFTDCQLRYSMRKPAVRGSSCNYDHDSGHNFTWLLTCKATFHEGLAQFIRRAEWIWRGAHVVTSRTIDGSWTKLFDTSFITRFELDVSNLANYSNHKSVCYRSGRDSRADLSNLADRLCAARLSNIESIRFVGYSDWLEGHPNDPHCGNQVGVMMQNLVSVFTGVHVKRWELGVYHDRPRCKQTFYWVLFEWVHNSKDDPMSGELKLLVDDRPEWQYGRDWIRQELKNRAEEEEEEAARRKIVGREWIRQELASRQKLTAENAESSDDNTA
ncbi:hypothetical protein CC86DRAFT_39056 [Ophiobolus disseminans]|uniref:Uncharacterized protein n=1 Tax=Ophiobolus disseminans TaxID=1469910 RepID=A0A6A6ZXP2_9PLEO|nr:hypothetical protein CC86DRAFT_39056 [Ophiobolus disseminans]